MILILGNYIWMRGIVLIMGEYGGEGNWGF